MPAEAYLLPHPRLRRVLLNGRLFSEMSAWAHGEFGAQTLKVAGAVPTSRPGLLSIKSHITAAARLACAPAPDMFSGLTPRRRLCPRSQQTPAEFAPGQILPVLDGIPPRNFPEPPECLRAVS